MHCFLSSNALHWYNTESGKYFVPLGRLEAARYHLSLHFATMAQGNLRITSEHFTTVADERVCNSDHADVVLDIASAGVYYIYLEATVNLVEMSLTP